MKPVVKQKLSTLQDIINNAQSGGGGGTVDAYTKAEADAKFETITGAAAAYLSKADAASTYLSKSDAASTYLSKTDAARMAHKVVAETTAVTENSDTLVKFTINNINSLPDLNGGIVIITCIEILDNSFDLMIYVYISELQNFFVDSTGNTSLETLIEFNNNTVEITKFGLNAAQNGKKYRMTLIY